MADNPWDRWMSSDPPAPTDLNRLYLGMLAAGLRPIETRDVGKAGESSGTRIIFACGCERLYVVRFRPTRESEHIRRCESHVNLLTSPPDWAQNDGTASKEPEQQET